jgi:hypothetical protein
MTPARRTIGSSLNRSRPPRTPTITDIAPADIVAAEPRLSFPASRVMVASDCEGRQAGVRECEQRAVGRVHLQTSIRRSTSGWPAARAPFFLSRTLPHVSAEPRRLAMRCA